MITNEKKQDQVIQSMFNEVVCTLKRGNAKEVGDLAKYTLEQYYKNYDSSHHFDLLQENFIDEYVNNESLVEGITDEKSIERTGLQEVYQYIFSNPMDVDFDIMLLKKLHELLFSKAPFPEAAGKFRNAPARIEGAAVELYQWEEIPEAIKKANKLVDILIKESSKVLEKNNPDELFKYIEKCVKLNCYLIHIHPFFDGNGRTVRAFTNKLFILAGIPPIYVHSAEVSQYHRAMENAIAKKDYNDIVQFYYIKICQSIYELSLNPNRNIKKRNTKRIIKRTVENYQTSYPCENCSANDLSTYFADNIKGDLNALGIFSVKHSVKKVISIPTDYEYLTVNIKKSLVEQSILIDPAFKIYVQENRIPFPEELSKEDKLFLIDVYKNGCAVVTPEHLNLYLETLSKVKTNYPSQIRKLKCRKN